MGSAAAVGIHNDLPAGEAAVALGAADDEPSGGVHVEFRLLIHQLGGDGGLNDHFDHVLANLLQRHLGAVLGGEHHGVHADGLVAIVLHRDLRLSIGPQIVHKSGLADLGELAGHFVCKGNGQGHQLRGLVAGVAEHHALIAGAVVQTVVCLALLDLQALVHAQRDIAGLLINVGDDAAGVAVKAVLGPVIADVPNDLTGDLGDVHIAAGGDLAHDVHKSGRGRGLAGHAAVGVLRQNGVQHGIGNLVADLVGMALRHGFGGEKIVSCHSCPSPFFAVPSRTKNKTHSRHGSARNVSFSAPHLSFPPELAP